MLRSMFTAITALTLNQTYMDVVADNLSNANTPGFKASRVTFKEQFAQLMAAGAGPTTELGGINPTQIGMGTQLGDITINFTQGTLQNTGRVSDLAIQGDGFFVYREDIEQYFSRDGSLEMDSQGFLVNVGTGHRIQGWSGSAGTIDNGTAVGDIQVPLDSAKAKATGNVYFGGNLDSTVGASAYSVTIGVYDSLGAVHDVAIQFTRQGTTNVWDWTATSGATGSGTVTFDTDGQYSAGGGSITVTGSGGAPNTVINLDMSDMTQLSTLSAAAAMSQDGLSAGELTGFNVISNTGEIFALYSNGLQEVIGQLGMAKFVNPSGLTRLGQNMWLPGLNSGEPEVGTANTGGRGAITSGYLEASNVDLGREFTNMIIAQRGFQAASRVITTSDQMLQELVNISR